MNRFYRMCSKEPDPRNSGDIVSWFFYYKWRNGGTSVPARDGCMDAGPGDVLVFVLDEMVVAMAIVTGVIEHNTQGERELQFDSDTLLVPKDPLHQSRPIEGVEGFVLNLIPEEKEPQWLKNLKTARP